MAQLSDDCFAFGGPMMSVDEAVGLIAARVRRSPDVESVALAMRGRPHSRARHSRRRCRCRLSPIPPSMAMRWRAAICRNSRSRHFPVTGRVQAGASATAPVKPGQAMRIFTGAPMPEGADTVFMQEDVRVEGDKVVLPRGPEARRQCASRGRGYSAGLAALQGRPAAAAAGCRACRGLRPDAARRRQAHPRRGVLHRQRTGLAGRSARRGAIVRFQPLHADGDAAPARLRGQRSRHPQRRSRRARARAAGGGRHATI